MLLKTSRRAFVQGAAGALLFAPLLRSVHAAETRPVRFVIFIEGNGTEPASTLYKRGTGATATAANKTATLKAIEAAGAVNVFNSRAYKHETVLTTPNAALAESRAFESLKPTGGALNLEDKAALILGLSSRVTGGSHTTYSGALGSRKASGTIPAGPTIDHTLSTFASVRRGSPFDAVRVGTSGPRVNYSTCAIDARKPAAISCDPTLTFNMLFGSVAAGAGAQRFTSSGQLLDFAREESRQALSAFGSNSLERAKVEAYATSLEDMVARRQQIIGMRDTLVATKPLDPEARAAEFASVDPLTRLSVQVDTAAAALIGGLTNVVVVSCGSGSSWTESFPSLLSLYPEGTMIPGHDLRHAAGGQPMGQVARDLLHEVTHRRVSEMSRMARKLGAVQEPNAQGTMLDYTVFLYMSDNGEMHHSNAEEWPILLIGGQRLGLRTDGRSLVYPSYRSSSNRQVSNIFNTLGHIAGADLNDYGAEGTARIAEGPLSEIWTSA